MLHRIQLAFLCIAFSWCALGAETIVLNDKRLHLRSGTTPEWDWFTNTPDARRFDVVFDSSSNPREATLFIRQDDVRHEWRVELNGKRLGTLHLMETDLVHTLRVPTGTLRNGTNTLSVVPPRENDDIVLHRVWLEDRPLTEVLSQATLEVAVSDAKDAEALPCRITVVDGHDSLAALHASSNALLAVRPGVVYTADGKARVGLLEGDYTVFASRGPEWSVATQHVHAVRGETTRVRLQLEREVDTRGAASCDTHVHTFTHSRHGDATTDERMLTLAGEGIELPVATDHNLHVDYTEPAQRMGVSKYFTPVPGNEVTTTSGHFNIFPVEPGAPVSDHKIADWPNLMNAMRATPGVRVVVLNHPRNVHNNFQPFAPTNYNGVTGENKRGPEFSFDAIELVNSSALQSDYMLVYREWFALLNHGYRITGVGSSDGHDVSRYIVGQGRTYIACDDANPGRISIDAACSNLLAGRATVSLGLIADVNLNERFRPGDLATNFGDELTVTLKVLGPSWISATNAQLYMNGTLVRETNITFAAGLGRGEKALIKWRFNRPSQDVHVVAIVTGPPVSAPFWATARPYQPSSSHWEGRVIASTNPIWVDGDRDGKFTAPRAYAKSILASTREPAALMAKLGSFDEAVAAQLASLCAEAGLDIDSSAFDAALAKGSPAARRGFLSFKQTRR